MRGGGGRKTERHNEQEVENTVLKFKYENCFLASPWINLEINFFLFFLMAFQSTEKLLGLHTHIHGMVIQCIVSNLFF